jgi:PAS domain S-box-containing protein
MNPQASVLLAALNQTWNPVVITSADASAGFPVEFANPAFCAMTGYALDELQGQSLKMLQGPDTDPAVIAELRECLRQERDFEGTTTNYRKDGTVYIVRWRISPVRNERGELTNFFSIQHDMTELARSRERTLLLTQGLDAASDPIMVADVNSQIIFVNKAFSKASGYLPEELIGKTPSMLKSGAHDATFYEDLYEALAAGKEFKANFINRRKDGSVYHNEQHISPVMDSHGKITHYISVSRDITDRVEREHALKQAASTDQLTGLFNRHYGAQLLNEAHRDALL